MILLPTRTSCLRIPQLRRSGLCVRDSGQPRSLSSSLRLDNSAHALVVEAQNELTFYKKRMEMYEKYEGWSGPQLLARIHELEDAADSRQQKSISPSSSAPAPIPPSAPTTDDGTVQRVTSRKNRGSNFAGPTSEPLDDPDVAPRHLSQTPPRRLDQTDGVSTKRKEGRAFDVSNSPLRKIAIRFAYNGANYSGLAQQGDGIPDSASTTKATNTMPTVEALLWNALCMARLVDPAKGMLAAGWSRCGRTDRGVSAAGQVAALWVRSRKVDERTLKKHEEERLQGNEETGEANYTRVGSERAGIDELATGASCATPPSSTTRESLSSSFSSMLLPEATAATAELPYVQALNKLLPESIRVLSWSPVHPSFNARFDCRYRHYKYFFTLGPPEHLLPPRSHPARRHAQPRLDLEAMREAASYLLGEHDFRNLCKVDASKQISNFRRRIDGVSIDEADAGWPHSQTTQTPKTDQVGDQGNDEKMYVLNLRGTAFLYHQVRHIMAVLFLVGAGLEKPKIVKELLNIREGAWRSDKELLKGAGVKGTGATVLPGSTATEPDGMTAKTSSPRLTAQMLSDLPAQLSELDIDEDDADLLVFERKPEYEMAADRPLVLWECGYRPQDVAWRTGPYDGALPQTERLEGTPLPDEGEATIFVANDLYRTWNQRAISAQLARHFFLAAASPAVSKSSSTSGIPAGTLYSTARWPALGASKSLPASDISVIKMVTPMKSQTKDTTRHKVRTQTINGKGGYLRPCLAFGNGIHRSAAQWKGLARRNREDTPQEKNLRWSEGKGKRKADEKKAAAAAAAQTQVRVEAEGVQEEGM